MEQTRAVDEVIVVDNQSSDGTLEMLADDFPEVHVVALAENRGATGGFYEAIKAAHMAGADWVWLLDDDSIAQPTALAELLDARERVDGSAGPDLMCSRVDWRDGNPHPMNRPVVLRRDTALVIHAVSQGLLPVRAATWVSLLLSRQAIDRVGLPPLHFFYQADDTEYTARILLDGRGYLVPRSVVEHRTPTRHTAVDDDHRFYYHARNTVLMLRGTAWRRSEKPPLVWVLLWSSLLYLERNRFSAASVRNVVRAILAGIRLRLPAQPQLVTAHGLSSSRSRSTPAEPGARALE